MSPALEMQATDAVNAVTATTATANTAKAQAALYVVLTSSEYQVIQ